METARYVRYILIGNRKILVEQPDGDKYRKATEDIAVGQSVEAIRTEECVLAITNEGLLFGSSVGTESHITPSEFAEATSGIYTPHSVIGHAYITRLPSVKSGMSTHHSAKGLVTTTKLGRAESGVITTHEAKGRKTQSRLAETSEGIGAGQRNETIYTTEPIFAEGVTGMGAGNKAEGKNTEAVLSQVQSGASAGQSAEATVDQPVQYILAAGTYVAQGFNTITPLTAISGNGYLIGGDETISFFSMYTDEEFLYFISGTPDNPVIETWGWVSPDYPYNYSWIIGTDDGTFTFTENVSVTAEQYALFNSYFKLATP